MAPLVAVDLLFKYAQLQSALCIKLAREYGIEDDLGVVFALPKSGKLRLRKEGWAFTRHGKGARLIRDSDSCVIDAVDMIISHPAALDAWRLIDYFESANIRQLTNNEEYFDVTTKAGIDNLLEVLANQGVLSVIDKSMRLYIFDKSS